MGLDAVVCCDCFEKGRLRSSPDPAWGVHVGPTGHRNERANDLDQQMAFDRWNITACEHEDGILLHHRLGNISLIALYRELLEPHVDQLPVIWRQVIYNGTHAGDFLSVADVERLVGEIEILGTIHAPDQRHELFLRMFETQLRELTACALRLQKPIAF